MVQTRTFELGAPYTAAGTEQFLTSNSPIQTLRQVVPFIEENGEETTDSLAIVTWNVVTLAGESTEDLALTGRGCGLNCSGKMKFLAKRFAEFHFDVLALQETRIPSNGLTKVGDYSCVGLASIKGHGGLQLWLHSRLKAQVLWHKSFGTRILAVPWNSLATRGSTLLYMPHMIAAPSQHTTYFFHTYVQP
eukprot:3187751-Amphidinium_carterae.1